MTTALQAKSINDIVNNFFDLLLAVLCAHATCKLKQLICCKDVNKNVVLLHISTQHSVVSFLGNLAVDSHIDICFAPWH